MCVDGKRALNRLGLILMLMTPYVQVSQAQTEISTNATRCERMPGKTAGEKRFACVQAIQECGTADATRLRSEQVISKWKQISGKKITLKLGAGHYKVSTTLSFRNIPNLSIQGQGPRTTWLEWV